MADAKHLQDKLDAVQPILDTLKSMFNTPQHADFTITCGDRKWLMNKAIVCAQSPVINAAMTGEFKEAKDGIYHCKDKETSVIAAMLHYMYHLDYHEEGNVNGQASTPPIIFNVHVHMAADYYQVPALAKVAASKFEKRAQEEWASDGFAQAAALIYAEAADKDHQLRNIVNSVVTKHAKELIKEDSGAHLRKMADEVPALGSALWQSGGDESSSKRCKCPRGCAFMVPLQCVEDYIGHTLYCMLCSQSSPAATWKARIVQ
ncbi:hypothetical protein LTR56_008592 [Elasticomyces elasticus]|nr:hypothetical protein LTR56_008592 [Elasticomyces elasticus]KAK3662198.1 hypothetical protein LTR22_006963 [Elasticomyces elasticus]KAK4916176.1 hypothetical protein LTR49_015817 [Elasticomyces elasticus]KAK5767962.1 hypothetical protein LTS12_001779 [Elasticomyces elasticus]